MQLTFKKYTLSDSPLANCRSCSTDFDATVSFSTVNSWLCKTTLWLTLATKGFGEKDFLSDNLAHYSGTECFMDMITRSLIKYRTCVKTTVALDFLENDKRQRNSTCHDSGF